MRWTIILAATATLVGCDDKGDACGDEDGAMSVFYADTDGDGFGDAADTRVGCDMPEGYIKEVGDCDDTDANVHPDATEVCDGVDNDCSGGVDDDATDGTTYYLDADADGFGNESSPTVSCDAPTGYITTGGDCNDMDADINPDADDICDEVDGNCDGTVDACGMAGTWGSEDADGRWEGVAEYDHTGESVALLGDVDGDGNADFAVGAPGFDDDNANQGAAFIVYGGDGLDDEHNLDDAAGWVGEAAGDQAGYSVAAAGDVDGDGYDDLLIGAPYADDTLADIGAAYLVYGDNEPHTAKASVTDADGGVFMGVDSYAYAGTSLAGVGDVDGDGNDDFVIGAPGCDESSDDVQNGCVYLVMGDDGDYGEQALDDHAWWLGPEAKANLGSRFALAGDDFDGDGHSDIAMGAPGLVVSNTDNGGGVFVVLGQSSGFSGEQDIDDADTMLESEYPDNAIYFGFALAAAGDLDGDGYPDLAIGGPYHDTDTAEAGAVWIFLGSSTAWADGDADDADAVYEGLLDWDYFGWNVSSAGDIDADGTDDLLVGAYGADDRSASAGVAYVFLGGDIGGSTLADDANVIIQGGMRDSYLGFGVAGGGDLDADGYDDVLIGMPGDDDLRGALLMFRGRAQ